MQFSYCCRWRLNLLRLSVCPAYLMQLSNYIHNNALRAGIVKRLVDYRWSSYPAYAYNRRNPKWLDKGLIRSQIHAPEWP